VHANAVLADAQRRLAADLRTRFSTAEVIVRAEADGNLFVAARDDTQSWGSTLRWLDLDEHDDFDDLEREHLVLMATEEIADNLWPDEATEPWPRCPRHSDHPLSPKMARGRASWVCSRDGSVAIPIGSLE
jgi:hypothetical protein